MLRIRKPRWTPSIKIQSPAELEDYDELELIGDRMATTEDEA